jgi:tRNA A-37 threonylcarbamoyl transferase component Bud32
VKWRRPRPGKVYRGFLRPSRERREARAVLRAVEAGIPLPRPLAVGERRSFGFLVGAVYVRPYVEGMWSFADAVEAGKGEAYVDRVAGALRDWHDRGLRHGDCYSKNVLVPEGQGPVLPIGAPMGRFTRAGVWDRARVRDLAQMAMGLSWDRREDLSARLLAAYGVEGRRLLAVQMKMAGMLERRLDLRDALARRGSAEPAPPRPLPPEDASDERVLRVELPLDRM